ncbi:uncharacterized protein RJT21DRAFT_51086 [Scheffersomyces amazonensis]|uniref:uncharacterized protein n=1 Tax=Scheffersomyces amazonensis TaxID=1078765 RepID=UPI00315CC722
MSRTMSSSGSVTQELSSGTSNERVIKLSNGEESLVRRSSTKDVTRNAGLTNLFFENSHLSKSHAAIKYMDGEFYLKDLQSTFGTILNGDYIFSNKYFKLKSNDVVGFIISKPSSSIAKIYEKFANEDVSIIPLSEFNCPQIALEFTIVIENDIIKFLPLSEKPVSRKFTLSEVDETAVESPEVEDVEDIDGSNDKEEVVEDKVIEVNEEEDNDYDEEEEEEDDDTLNEDAYYCRGMAGTVPLYVPSCCVSSHDEVENDESNESKTLIIDIVDREDEQEDDDDDEEEDEEEEVDDEEDDEEDEDEDEDDESEEVEDDESEDEEQEEDESSDDTEVEELVKCDTSNLFNNPDCEGAYYNENDGKFTCYIRRSKLVNCFDDSDDNSDSNSDSQVYSESELEGDLLTLSSSESEEEGEDDEGDEDSVSFSSSEEESISLPPFRLDSLSDCESSSNRKRSYDEMEEKFEIPWHVLQSIDNKLRSSKVSQSIDDKLESSDVVEPLRKKEKKSPNSSIVKTIAKEAAKGLGYAVATVIALGVYGSTIAPSQK